MLYEEETSEEIIGSNLDRFDDRNSMPWHTPTTQLIGVVNMSSCGRSSGPWLPRSVLCFFLIWPADRQYYKNMYEEPEDPIFPSFQVKKTNPKIKCLVPYKLEKTNFVLFPEWYYLFIKKVSQISPQLNAYCKFSPYLFHLCFEGEYPEALDDPDYYIKQFSDYLKAGLGALFEHGFEYNRPHVEQFLPKIMEKKYYDYTPLIIRKNQLIQFAKKGKFEPLIDFLKAYCLPERAIWMQLLEVCLPNGVPEKTRLDVASKYRSAKKTKMTSPKTPSEEGLDLFEIQIRRFHSALEKDGYFPISDGSQVLQPSSTQPLKKRNFPGVSTGSKKGKFANERTVHLPQKELNSFGSRKRAFKEWCGSNN